MGFPPICKYVRMHNTSFIIHNAHIKHCILYMGNIRDMHACTASFFSRGIHSLVFFYTNILYDDMPYHYIVLLYASLYGRIHKKLRFTQIFHAEKKERLFCYKVGNTTTVFFFGKR